MEVEWLGHSSFRIELDGTTFVTDPAYSVNPNAPVSADDVDEADFILVSHGHFDHASDVEAVAESTDAPVVAVAELAATYEGQGLDAIMRNPSAPLDLGTGVGVGLVEMDHSSSLGLAEGDPTEGGVSVGFVLEGSDRTVFFAGDTGICANLKVVGEVYDPDVSFLPISGGFVMDAEEAGIAAEWLGSETVVPMHYDSLDILPPADVDAFVEGVEGAGGEAAVLDPTDATEL